jgi:carboxyl-terminal processing protease
LGIEPNAKVELADKYKDLPVSQIPKEDDAQLKKAMELVKK